MQHNHLFNKLVDGRSEALGNTEPPAFNKLPKIYLDDPNDIADFNDIDNISGILNRYAQSAKVAE